MISPREPAARGPSHCSDGLLGAAPLLAVLALAALRFEEFARGGLFTFRDAGYFFLPLRHVVALSLRAGELPLWNDFASSGRALAADPNGAVFWPLTPLLLAVSPSALVLVHIALCLTVFFASLRWAGFGPAAAGSASAVLLLSGVFQTLPVLFTTLASAAPLPLAVAALGGDWPEGRRVARRRAAIGGLALGLSFLGGEPVITAMGAAAAVLLALCRSPRLPRLLAAGGALVLAVGLSSVQLIPALGELSRSARTERLRPEDGALFWSVRPSRVLTLLEPRLTGDPFGERDEDFWGAATFDAGNPYFYDFSIGLLPLLLAASAGASRRGKAALLLAFAAALLSFGRFVPGYAAVAGHVPFVRYPEKWWVLATFLLAAAVGAAVESLTAAGREERDRTARRLWAASAAAATLLLTAFALSALAPDGLRALLWRLGLGAGAAAPRTIASVLTLPLAFGAATAALALVLAGMVRKGRLRGGTLLVFLAPLFLLDGARRVVGQCPAGEPDLMTRRSPAIEAVEAEMTRGRFYDDGADDPATAVRRSRENGGFDPLRPIRGVFHGIRYAGENDVDRMTPAPSVAWSAYLARLPWGREKVERLRDGGVSVARTAAPGPDPPGVRELLRSGGDRIVAIDGARPEFFAPGGGVEVVERRPGRQRLRISSPAPVHLAVAKTFDPSWKARYGSGRVPAPVVPDGPFMALLLPPGTVEVELRYENWLILWGALVSAVSLGAIFLLARRGPR